MNPALTEPTSPNSDPSADDHADAPAAVDADPPNGDDDDDDDDDDDEEAASPAQSEPPLAKAVSDSIEKKKRKRGGDGGDAKGEEEKTADAKGDPDEEAGNGRSKALKVDGSAAASASNLAAASSAPSFDMPPITIDPNTGKASIEINVKGNEGRVIGKGGETVKHIERKFAVKIEMRRERGTCVVTGAEAVMRDAAALISEVIERGDVNKGDRASAAPIPSGSFGGPQMETPGTMIAKLLASAQAKIDSGEDASAADFPEVLRGDDMEEHVAIEVPCPGQEGRVIGRGGATIKEIERQSGASAKVVKGTGRCDVSGPRGRVILARRIVLETMALPVDPFGAGAPGKREAGDWTCPQCNASCFRSKTSCFNCGAPKPAAAYGQPQQMGYGQPQQMGYGQPQQMGYGMQQQQGYGMQQPMMGGGYGGGGGAKTSVEVPCMGSEGRIIGKGGDMIKYIQNSTGTKLDMRRDKGTVQVTGTPEAVAAAEAMVREVIENGDTRDKGGLQPPQNLGQPGMGGGQGQYAQPVGGGQVMGGGYAMAPPGQVQMVAVPVQGGYVQAGQPMAQGQYGQPMMMAVPAQQGQAQYQYQPQGQYAYVDASQVQGAVYVPQQQTAAQQQQPGAQAVAGAEWGQAQQQQQQQQQAAAAPAAAPAGGEWQTHYSEGRAYYYNTATGETRWA